MADTKITGLTNFDSSNTPYWPPAPASDVIPIVDVSDTTMAGSGTTKKISINNLLSSSPTATGALTVTGLVTAGSATITGALTGNGGVNLANATAVNFGGLLTIYSDTAAGLFIRGRTTGGTTFQTQDGTNPLLNISNAGVFTFSDGAGGTRMTLNASGNLLVGATAAGTSAAKVLAIGTGTEPTTGPAGTVQLFTSTRSASNTIPAIFTEGSGVTNAAITNTTVTNKIAIKVNGTIYYLLATTSAA